MVKLERGLSSADAMPPPPARDATLLQRFDAIVGTFVSPPLFLLRVHTWPPAATSLPRHTAPSPSLPLLSLVSSSSLLRHSSARSYVAASLTSPFTGRALHFVEHFLAHKKQMLGVAQPLFLLPHSVEHAFDTTSTLAPLLCYTLIPLAFTVDHVSTAVDTPSLTHSKNIHTHHTAPWQNRSRTRP
jgi:hypothetical protein